MTTRGTARWAVGIVLGAWGLLTAARGAPAAIAETRDEATLLVFAAASLAEALDEVDRAFTAQSHVRVKASYAASSVLAKQIEAGAPADVFFSADQDWLDYLERRSLMTAGTRADVLGNELALIAPADSSLQLKIAPGFALAPALGKGRLAVADPDSVPAGRYAREALTKLGVWDGVQPRLARAENVRAALAFVARGEVPLGIVYRTDARAEKRVRIVDVFPTGTHTPILYAAGATAHAQAETARYLKFLDGPEARAIFSRFGFVTRHGPAH
ncbi:MAG: molybdate ABC transporter substrate-binding protein [Proteobacteria bacterium]|nr:molybdate ABC transporter substrate-binding protein [Pseudomonadota bacterium]